MDNKLVEIIVNGRQEAKLKQSDVGKLLGVKGNTISDWERGRTEPDIDSFIQLCKIYKINAAAALNSIYDLEQNEDFLLTKSEISYVKKYRTLDDYGKSAIDFMLEHEYNRCQSITDNEQIHEDEIEYNIIPMPFHDDRASAGFGDEFLADSCRIIKVIGNRNTIRADFVLQVDGRSMEPLYNDGDYVLVHQQPAIDIGEIGIFAVGDKGYIKKLGEDRLISVNPDFPDAQPEEYQEYKCFGKVIGKLDPEWIVE